MDLQINFQLIPEDYLILKDSIESQIFKDIYSYFDIRYYKYEKEDKLINKNLKNYLKDFKFITYQFNSGFSSDTNQKNIYSTKSQNSLKRISPSTSQNAIICVESECLIFENIIIDEFYRILDETESARINVSQDDIFSLNQWNQTKTEKEAINEVSSFCNHFKNEINSNSFINYTIRPMISYLIRRYYYPSSYFKDRSFFNLKKISKIKVFQEREFIVLRPISSRNQKLINLVMNIDNLGIFVMKKVGFLNNNDIFFDEFYSHQYFCPFYGFIEKSKNKKIGFLYEFMSNGSIKDIYEQENKDPKSYFYSFYVLIRIFKGLSYLKSNSLIHRDIQPSNILVNHDENPFFADNETIKKLNDSYDQVMSNDYGNKNFTSPEQYLYGNISFEADVFSFGVFIYYLFEKQIFKFDYENIPQMKSFSDDIKELYVSCVNIDPQKRPDIEEIRTILSEHLTNIENLRFYFPVDKSININENEMFLYFNEMVTFLDPKYLQKYKELFPDFSYFLVYFGDLFKNGNGVTQDYKMAKKLYEMSELRNNNPIAQLNLGDFYCKGLGVEIDYTKAREFYELSAKQGNGDALDFLGNLYLHGRGVTKDYDKAIEYYKEAQKKQNADAIFTLGYLHYTGRGVKQDYGIALDYYKQSAALDYSYAYNGLGNIYSLGLGIEKDYVKALEYYKKAADLGNSNALLNLGNIYSNGDLNISVDNIKAKEFYERAVNLGNTKAMNSLGNLYFIGKGIEQDYEKALSYFRMAAKKGDLDSYNMIGYYYDKIEQNYGEAKKFYEIAAKQNHPNALNNLGCLYYHGWGMARDFFEAKKNFEKSASLNNARGFFLLARLYLNGEGVKKDILKAKELLIKSKKKNYPSALFVLGDIYFNEKDYAKAKECYEEALKSKNNDAALKLGILYLYGYGIKSDYKTAFHYFQSCEKEVNINALYYLALMYENGKCVDIDIETAIQYYLKSISSQSEHYKLIYNQGYVTEVRNNDYYYISYNNLGLIYLLEKNDLDTGVKYIKEAAFAEYPFGQNNLGLINQFFKGNKKEAKRYFEKALKNTIVAVKFPLVEYNLGYFYEVEEQNKDEAINHYINALEYENAPLIYKNVEIKDERLQISNLFINCYLHFKLILMQEKIDVTKMFIIALFKPMFFLLFQSDYHSYSFQFLYQKVQEKKYLINVKDFIINFPLLRIKSSRYGWQAKKEDSACKRLIIRLDVKEEKLKDNFLTNEKNNIISNDISNDNEFDPFINDSSFHQKIDEILNEINQDNRFQITSLNAIENETQISFEFKFAYDDVVRCLQFPKCIFSLLFQDLVRLKQMAEEICIDMKNALYKPNYPILFGRFKQNNDLNI
ncbi:hypothetical protein M9Y10_015436 [Tritrichomonas musculus]|uniref:Protein kinase domain-containing protein n=1 Tax=Tritrichomonas musculus TaxID=1915356 RepID=A0ABR2L428_9EUKA